MGGVSSGLVDERGSPRVGDCGEQGAAGQDGVQERTVVWGTREWSAAPAWRVRRANVPTQTDSTLQYAKSIHLFRR